MNKLIINDLNLPKTSNHKDILAFLYILQKLLLEFKKCDLAFSLKNNQLNIRCPNHIIKLSFHFSQDKAIVYPLQLFISAHHRDMNFIEQTQTLSIYSANDFLSKIETLFLLIFQLPVILTQKEYSLSQPYD